MYTYTVTNERTGEVHIFSRKREAGRFYRRLLRDTPVSAATFADPERRNRVDGPIPHWAATAS